MPESQKQRISKKCQKASESGDEKDKLFANSGMQCVVEEVFTYGEKHALYNKCAEAKKLLEETLAKIKDGINEKKEAIRAPAEKIKRDLDEERKTLISKLKTEENNLTVEINGRYEKELESKKTSKLEEAKTNNEWINKFKNYKNEVAARLKQRGVDILSTLKNVGQEFGKIMDEYKETPDVDFSAKYKDIKNERLKKVAEGGTRFVNVVAKGVKVAEKISGNAVEEIENHIDGKKEARGEVKEEVQAYLRRIAQKIVNDLYQESKTFFEAEEAAFKEALIKVVTNENRDTVTEAEKEILEKVIKEFPKLDDIKAVELQNAKITRYLFFVDLGDINYKNLEEESKKKLGDKVSEKTSDIQEKFKASFLEWSETLIDKIESEITSLNPNLKDLNKKREKYREELKHLQSINSKIETSYNNLNELLSSTKEISTSPTKNEETMNEGAE